ncbi:MAG: hypothetical protein V1702_03120 [Candidatus Woesearchaeota archaeon]
MFKKAQGMSINVIIIAIIVLIVLVILVMIFTGYFGGWTKSVATCQSQGGTCQTDPGQFCYNVMNPSQQISWLVLEAACPDISTGKAFCCPAGGYLRS